MWSRSTPRRLLPPSPTLPDLARYPRIWCSQCEGLTPLALDEMPANELNDHGAMDLMCGECRLVVATVHEAAAPIWQKLDFGWLD